MNEFEVISVNISEKKGTIKTPEDFITLDNAGVVNDAHAGPWNRQVSLLARESIEKFESKNNKEINPGEFAENITTRGIKLHHCQPLDVFQKDELLLEVSQIGKKCHGSNCAIFQEVGNCVMPTEGIFCRVKNGGKVYPGNHFTYKPKTFKVSVITLSDRVSSGVYEDRSGPYLEKRLKAFFSEHNRAHAIDRIIIPDDADLLSEHLSNAFDNEQDAIFTTGGTGIGPRDITPDIIKEYIDKELPGIMELVRYKYGSDKPQALLSRSIAGVKGKMLIYSIPGSAKAVEEYMNEILPTLMHSFYMVNGLDMH